MEILLEKKENITIDDLINKIKEYNNDNLDIVTKAYNYAAYLHDGQTRQSGEPYIIHPLNVAYILADMHADSDTICAGLLHDTLEDTKATKEDISYEFNQEIANLVDGVTKLAKMNFSSKVDESNANTRKIITSITNDVRIIIIKLADRLHNMRTLQYKSKFKQQENALETIELFAPLAYSIGAYRIKNELEDLSLRYLKPDSYQRISEIKSRIEKENKALLEDMLNKIHEILLNNNIPSYIKIRTKNIYGIYKKLESGERLSNIHDLLALKVMVDEIFDCYISLCLIHSLYNPYNKRFKDYICNKKTNKYQSLHTTVFAPEEKLVQIQIRTHEMDKTASFGLIAYWSSRGENARDIMQKELREKYQFYSSLVEIDDNFRSNQDFVNQIKYEVLSHKVYIYNTDGTMLELPLGSTPIDYAYNVSEYLGNTMVGVLVNDEPVPYDYLLQNKDRIKILTDISSYGPKPEWYNYAKTSLAKKRIKNFLEN